MFTILFTYSLSADIEFLAHLILCSRNFETC